MVDAEWNRRQQNRLARCIREAHFADPAAMIEDIEYHEDRRLDKSQILRFATCKYIEDGHHIILKGASGSGKTFLACALGNAACRKYKSVRYIRLPELLEELSLAQASGELKKLIKSYRKYDLLILDEWLIRCLTPQESYNLLDTVLQSWFHNIKNAEQAKAEILALFSEEPGDGYTWSEQDIWEQSRKIINRWNRM